MKKLKDLNIDEYKNLKDLGILKTMYPEATGDFEKDAGFVTCIEKSGKEYEGGCEIYEVGDWVTRIKNNGGAHVRGRVLRIILCEIDQFVAAQDNDKNIKHLYSSVRKATEEEIKQHLIKEAEKRGYEEGVKVKSMIIDGMNPVLKGKLRYDREDDYLTDNVTYLYEKGEWAEIVKEEPIKIGSNEVSFDKNFIKVGCQSFPNSLIKDIKSVKANIWGTDIRKFEINYEDKNIYVQYGSTRYVIDFDKFNKIIKKLQD